MHNDVRLISFSMGASIRPIGAPADPFVDAFFDEHIVNGGSAATHRIINELALRGAPFTASGITSSDIGAAAKRLLETLKAQETATQMAAPVHTDPLDLGRIHGWDYA